MSFPVHNSFGLPVQADAVYPVHTLEQLRERLQVMSAAPLIVGAGSNMLFVSERLQVPVLMPLLKGIQYRDEADEPDAVLVDVGAGEVWHELVLDSLQKGLCGLENLSLIPGTVGAAPIQNIGAYGVEVKERIVAVAGVDLYTGELRELDNAECQFAYRDSVFKRKLKDRFMVTSVRFRLHRRAPLQTHYEALAHELARHPEQPLTARRISDAVIAVRRARLPDPVLLGNAGSFFKNPVVETDIYLSLLQRYPDMPHYPQSNGQIKLAAGWLIDRAGLKGIRRGAAGTHAQQALVIVNHGGASGQDILNIAREVRDTVLDKFAVALQPEVRLLDEQAQDIVL